MTPIGYLWRALRDYEKCYAQIEKETISIIFRVGHFHDYLYGRRFIVINDHKSLNSIFNSSVMSCPPGIRKIFLRLQKYDFELQYSSVKDMPVSETLSRPHLSRSELEFTEDSLIHHVHFVLSNLPISETRLNNFNSKSKGTPFCKR